MNEQIKQLAKEAGYYLYDLTETHECKTVETDSKDEWITLEKFAELIVKDIMENLSFHGHEDAVSQVQWHAANKYGIKV
jgi:hypothetical protein